MNALQLTVVILLSCLGKLDAQSKECDELAQQGDTTVCKNFKKGKLSEEHYSLNGKYLFTRRWFHKKSGAFECYYYNNPKYNAKMNGPVFLFYPNGQLKACSFMEHDKRVGPCRQYFTSGQVQHTCQGHVKGKMHGIETEFYENGQVRLKLRWEYGRLMEVLKYQDDRGGNLFKGTFKDGNGDYVYQEGNKPPMVITYKNGKPVKKKRLQE